MKVIDLIKGFIEKNKKTFRRYNELAFLPYLVAILLIEPTLVVLNDLAYHPDIEVSVVEVTDTPPGIWKTFIYWKEQYSVYEVRISNQGTYMAEELKLYFHFPGLIYAVQPDGSLGVELDLNPVYFTNYNLFWDPYFVGQNSFPSIDEETEPIFGGSMVGFRFSVLAKNETQVFKVYIDKSKSIYAGFEFEGRYHFRNNVEILNNDSLIYSKVPWKTPEFTNFTINPYSKHNDVRVSVDFDKYKEGLQVNRVASPGEEVNVTLNLDLSDYYRPNSMFFVNAIGDWDIHNPLGYLFGGVADYQNVSRSFMFTAPSTPGEYRVRVFVVSTYDYPYDYYFSNLDAASGFECRLTVESN